MKRLSYERRIQFLALAAGLPGSFIALILLWYGGYSARTAWTLTFLIVSLWLGFALSLRHRVVFSLQTLSNLLSAMREEDFSFRAREARSDDALGEVMLEVNALSETLRSQRLGAMEATGLLRAVMEEPSSPSTIIANCASSTAPASAFSQGPANGSLASLLRSLAWKPVSRESLRTPWN
jgi:hypothetical protein